MLFLQWCVWCVVCACECVVCVCSGFTNSNYKKCLQEPRMLTREHAFKNINTITNTYTQIKFYWSCMNHELKKNKIIIF